MSSNQQAEAYYALMLGGITPGIYLSGELPEARPGLPYSASLTLHGARLPAQWDVLGVLPPGFEINPDTGEITGAPAMPLEILDMDETAVIGTAFSVQLAAQGGSAPYAWDVLVGALPPGLTLDPTTGQISGMPSE